MIGQGDRPARIVVRLQPPKYAPWRDHFVDGMGEMQLRLPLLGIDMAEIGKRVPARRA